MELSISYSLQKPAGARLDLRPLPATCFRSAFEGRRSMPGCRAPKAEPYKVSSGSTPLDEDWGYVLRSALSPGRPAGSASCCAA